MSSDGEARLVEPLTEREQEVLELLAQGKSNRELADALVLSINTVKWHNRQIYGKLDVNNREQAAERAQQLGLLGADEEPLLPQSNLPAAPGKLIGRQMETAELDELLADPERRLITITGVGGVGKTRLAHAVAARQLEKRPHLFVDGIYWISLSSYDTPEELLPAIAGALGLPLRDPAEDGRSRRRQFTDYLHEKKMLLVLDNFEHLLDGARFIGQLLRRTAAIQLLVTSRERLKLRQEHLLPLTGFGDNNWHSMVAAADPFVQLFQYSARRVRPDFELTPADLGHLSRLHEITGGLPLAVELAASWVEVLPLWAIAAEIRQDIDFLQTDLRNVPPRQRSMRAVFEVSWRRLDPAHQTAFASLSLFRGGFTRMAAHEVSGVSVRDLAALSAKSLLQYDSGHDRYHIHELLRQFGERKLQSMAGLERATRDRHTVFYCGYLQQREQAWAGEGADEALAEVERERGNVRLAWKWAVEQGDVSLLATGLRSLCSFYAFHGYEAEARELLRAASESLLPRVEDEDNDVDRHRLLIRLLSWRGRFAPSVDEAFAMLGRAETLLQDLQQQKTGVRREEAFLAWCRGLVARAVDPAASRPHIERSLSLYRELEDAAGQAAAITSLSHAEWHLGNYDEAADLARRGLDEHKALGNLDGVARGLNLLGLIEKHRGRLRQARQAHRESYALRRQLGDRSGAVTMAGNLATTLCWSGKFAEARTIAMEGQQLAEEVGLPVRAVYLKDALADACIHCGRYDEAQEYVERALSAARATGARQTLGWALMSSGKLTLVSEAYEKATPQLEEAASVLAKFGKSTWMLPLLFQALALVQSGQPATASRVLAQALRENMKVRVPHIVISALPGAALVVAERDSPRALALYALASRHPFVANSRLFEDVVGEKVDELAAALPDDVVAGSRERGKAQDLWETAEELLVEFGDVSV